MQRSIDTVAISKLNKAKDILSRFFVGIFSCSLNSGIKYNTALVSDFEELLQVLQIDILNRVNPNCSFQSGRI
jgi:hypothetical protein